MKTHHKIILALIMVLRLSTLGAADSNAKVSHKKVQVLSSKKHKSANNIAKINQEKELRAAAESRFGVITKSRIINPNNA